MGNIADTLVYYRQRRGLTADAVAAAVGVPLGTYWSWEADGEALPDTAQLRALTGVLGLHTQEHLQRDALHDAIDRLRVKDCVMSDDLREVIVRSYRLACAWAEELGLPLDRCIATWEANRGTHGSAAGDQPGGGWNFG